LPQGGVATLTKTHNFDIRNNKPLKVSKTVIHFNFVFLGLFLGHNILLNNPHDYKNMFSYVFATIYSKNQDITRPLKHLQKLNLGSSISTKSHLIKEITIVGMVYKVLASMYLGTC